MGGAGVSFTKMHISRLVGMVLLLPLCTLGRAQDLAAPVTYKTVAVPASRAVQDLTGLSHVQLEVEAPLDVQPIIVRLEKVPLQEAMDRIAKVLRGQWAKRKDTWVLSRSVDQQEAILKLARDKRAEQFKAQVANRMAGRPSVEFTEEEINKALHLPSNQHGNEVEMQAGSMLGNTGSARLTDVALNAIDLTDVVADPFATRIVFSSSPRPLQRPLNLSSEQVASIYREQNLWTAVGKKVDAESPLGDKSFGRHMIDPSDARIVVALQISEDGSSRISTSIVNSQDEQYVSAYEDVEEGYGTDDPDPSIRKPFQALALKPVTVSAVSREMRSLLTARYNDGETSTRPADAELRQLLLNPTKHDPLSFAPSEMLLGIGEEKAWNVVATLSDELAFATGGEDAGGSDPASFLAQVSLESEVNTAGGWLTVRPLQPLFVEARRTNREALEAYVQSVQGAGYSALINEAQFAAGNERYVDDSLATFWAAMIKPMSQSFDETDWHTLRFYGLLDHDQRGALRDGHVLLASQLTADQKDAVADMALDPPFTDFDFYAESSAPPRMSTDPNDRQFWQRLDNEPSEELNELVPMTAQISVTSIPGHAIKMRGQSDDGAWEMWVHPQYALRLIRRNKGEDGLSFAAASTVQLKFRITLSEHVKLGSMLTEYHNDLTSWGKLAQLPPDLQKELAVERKNLENGPPFGGDSPPSGSDTPPPPR